MNIELVIFDFDGTLADTHRTIIATVQQTLQELRHPIASEAAITATIGLPLRDCYRHYLPNLDEAGLDACEATHHRLFDINRKTNPPVPFPMWWKRSSGLESRASKPQLPLHEHPSPCVICWLTWTLQTCSTMF